MAMLYSAGAVERGEIAAGRQGFSLSDAVNSSVLCSVDGIIIPGNGERQERRDTEFHCLVYHSLLGEGHAPKRLVYDCSIGVVSEVSPVKGKERVDVFRLFRIGGKTLPSYIVSAKKAAEKINRFRYDGTWEDAIREFAMKEYAFYFWDKQWKPLYINCGETSEHLSSLRPVECAGLDDLLTKVRQIKIRTRSSRRFKAD